MKTKKTNTTDRFTYGNQDDGYLHDQYLTESKVMDYAKEYREDNDDNYTMVYKLVPYAKIEKADVKITYL